MANDAQGFSLSITLKTLKLERKTKAYTARLDEIANIAIPEEFSSFVLFGYPSRRLVVKAYENVEGIKPNLSLTAPIQIRMNDRIHAERAHNILLTVRYFDYHLNFLAFIDGKLRGRFDMTTLLHHFSMKNITYEINTNSTTLSGIHTIYWPRILSYREIQNISKSEIQRLGGQERAKGRGTKMNWMSSLLGGGNKGTEGKHGKDEKNGQTKTLSPERRVNANVNACVSSDGETIVEGSCVPLVDTTSRDMGSSAVSVLLTPAWYFYNINVALPIPEYLLPSHLLDCLYSVLESDGVLASTVNSENKKNIVQNNNRETDADKTTGLKPPDEATVQQLEVLILAQPGDEVAFTKAITTASAVSPDVSIRIVPWEAKQSYSSAVLSAVDESRGDILVFLNSDVLLEKGALEALVEAVVLQKAAVVGGVIHSTRGTVVEAGYSMLPIPFAGGLESYLAPLRRYR